MDEESISQRASVTPHLCRSNLVWENKHHFDVELELQSQTVLIRACPLPIYFQIQQVILLLINDLTVLPFGTLFLSCCLFYGKQMRQNKSNLPSSSTCQPGRGSERKKNHDIPTNRLYMVPFGTRENKKKDYCRSPRRESFKCQSSLKKLYAGQDRPHIIVLKNNTFSPMSKKPLNSRLARTHALDEHQHAELGSSMGGLAAQREPLPSQLPLGLNASLH